MKSKIKTIRVILMIVVAVVLAAGTVFERYHGAEWVGDHFYGSWWFAVLMGLVAVGAIVSIVQGQLWKRPSALLTHAAIPIILLGGALTTWTGEHYSITLAPGETKEGITLERFEVVNYPGTHTPMDFVSHISCEGETFDISMNHIYRHNGRRYYQEDYDDEGRSTLSVSHDPWGIPVVYTGFALLLIGLGWLMLTHPSVSRQAADSSPSLGEQPDSNASSRTASASSSPKLGEGDRPKGGGGVCKTLLMGLFLLLPVVTNATPRTLPKQTAAKMGEMYTLYKGRICPLQTYAKDFTTKLTGKATYEGLSSEQVLSGFLFYYSEWEPMLDEVSPKRKNESEGLVKMLLSGRGLKLFPVADSTGRVGWYAQNDDLPMTIGDDEYIFVRKQLGYCQELVMRGDFEELEHVFEKTRQWQEKQAANVLPSPARVKAERLYNALTTGRWLAMLAITLGLLFFAYSLWNKGMKRSEKTNVLSALYLLVLTSYLLLIFILRWIAGGHIPMAGGFDSMNLMAIVIGIIGIAFSFKQSDNRAIKQSSAMLTMGFCLLVAMMSGSNPPVTNLMPVLNSPLLCLHVAVIMMSYALFFFLMMIGIAGLIIGKKNPDFQYSIFNLAKRLLYPAVFLLTLGIIIGALWANISWGNYWSWDPKEVWALITLIVYALPLHPSLAINRSARSFHLYCTLAFLSVIVTYFGVNLFLGGIHAYM
ncbi:MAG: cytochrome c biogenesis protein CcsA [Bacteroidales bacterium]|nr:cytochrome c biogenesis protein CcsA [Bacteroidales bacterium]